MIDVVIAGAGPNGLMLAGELALAGLRPVVLDPMPGPNPGRRANGVIGQGVRILDHRGLYNDLAGSDGPPQLNPRAMFAAFPLDLATVPEAQVFLLAVQQPRLVQALADRAAERGVDIRWGHALTGFEQDADAVTLCVTGPGGPYELRAGYVVGADGGTSRTRKLAGIDFPGMSSYDVTARMGFDVLPPADWIDPATGGVDVPGYGRIPPLHFHRAERGVIASGALGGRPAVIVFELDSTPRMSPPDTGTVAEPPMTLEELEASAKRVLGADLPLRPAAPGTPLDLRRFSGINSRIASSYRAGRVFLVGDAAHVHSPMGGPGLNLGLQDAVNLGWKLAAVVQGRASGELLDTYEAERRPAAERVIMHSRAQLALVRPGPEVTALRQLFGELLAAPEAVRRLTNLVSGAENRYLAGADGADEHPLTGYWVPDFAVVDGRGSRRVAELARTGRPLLIDLTDGAVVAAAVADRGDDDALTVAAGRPDGPVPASALLMRPDGYVAWASSASAPDDDELRRLRDTLARWFGIGVATPDLAGG